MGALQANKDGMGLGFGVVGVEGDRNTHQKRVESLHILVHTRYNIPTVHVSYPTTQITNVRAYLQFELCESWECFEIGSGSFCQAICPSVPCTVRQPETLFLTSENSTWSWHRPPTLFSHLSTSAGVYDSALISCIDNPHFAEARRCVGDR